MRNYRIISVIVALLLSQYTFANTSTTSDSGDVSFKPCETVINACLGSGFTKEAEGKNFWIDCMKPILLGKTVADVSVGAKDATACRKFKIVKMKKELKEFEAVK